MIFTNKALCLTLLVGLTAISVISATNEAINVSEDSKLDTATELDSKKQTKRGADDSPHQQQQQQQQQQEQQQQHHHHQHHQQQHRQNINLGPSSSPQLINFSQFYGGNYAQLGHLFASPAAPQIYYVKAPQSNHAGVQYASPNNALKIAYASAPQPPQHSFAYATAPTNAKVAIAPQPLYQPYQLSYTHQPLSYSPAAIALPYNHQQQIIPIAHTNGYQLAAIPHQQVQISQPYSYVTAAPIATGKVGPTSNVASNNNAYQEHQTFTFPTYQQHVAAPINIPTTQKFVAFPSYSHAQYKTLNAPAQPSTTTATHTAGDGATSFATFSQQLNHHHHSTPTAVTPAKVLAQPHQYYVTVPPPHSPAAYNSQKFAFQPVTAASSSPQAYESPHNVNGVIHYGTHLYHPALAKYAYGQNAPPQKLIYSH